MMELCLFDLDQTLARTDDLNDIRLQGVRNSSPAYATALKTEFDKKLNRAVYSLGVLNEIKVKFPNLKLGVFTRSPSVYANLVLAWLYPNFTWDIVIAYEDVSHRKPHGEGIDIAMNRFNFSYLDKTVLVGDSSVDIRAAYNAGCLAVLDKTTWEFPHSYDQWHALELLADGIISSPRELISWLSQPSIALPDLEYRLDPIPNSNSIRRFEKINYFFPKAVSTSKVPTPIFVAGRLFSDYASIKYRKQWHKLTHSILEHKDATTFPVSWLESVNAFIRTTYPLLVIGGELTIAVIPARPGRTPRLEYFLSELAKFLLKHPFGKAKILFAPKLLTYSAGVVSSSREHLSRDERFINVRDHLRVDTSSPTPQKILVIDDVATSGATLLYAHKYLTDSGALSVTCFSFAKNISDVI